MRRAGSGLVDLDSIKNREANYARVAQLYVHYIWKYMSNICFSALKAQKSPVHWRGLNRMLNFFLAARIFIY